MYVVWGLGSNFIRLRRDSQLSGTLVAKTIISPMSCCLPLAKFSWPLMKGCITGFSIKYHWSVCLSSWQYHNVYLLLLCLRFDVGKYELLPLVLRLFYFVVPWLSTWLLGLAVYFFSDTFVNFPGNRIESTCCIGHYRHLAIVHFRLSLIYFSGVFLILFPSIFIDVNVT